MKLNPRTRRAFLQGAGGVALAIPFLGSLDPTRSRAVAQAKPPLRFVFMGAIFGRDIDGWYPAQDPSEQAADGVYVSKLSDISGPISYTLGKEFDAVRGKMSILRGLDSMQAGDAHVPTVPLTASGSMTNGIGFGYSLDAVLEESKSFYPAAPMLTALRTCPSADWAQLSFSYTARSGEVQSIWHEWDPKVVYKKFFDPSAVQKQAMLAVHKRGLIDSVLPDYKRVLGARRIASADKQRLENYVSILSDAHKRLGVAPVACPQAHDPGNSPAPEALHSATIDLEVAALACGMTNIVCHNIMQYAPEPHQYDGHTEAHQGNRAASDPKVTQHAIHNKWVMTRVAEFMTKLDAVQDSSGTLLDNTLFVYGNTESRGFHVLHDMPVIVAGGGGKLRTGYYVDYRPRPFNYVNEGGRVIAGRPYNNLLTSMFKLFGFGPDQYQRFGLRGFGVYDQFAGSLKDHYAPFLKDRTADLPLLLV